MVFLQKYIKKEDHITYIKNGDIIFVNNSSYISHLLIFE